MLEGHEAGKRRNGVTSVKRKLFDLHRPHLKLPLHLPQYGAGRPQANRRLEERSELPVPEVEVGLLAAEVRSPCLMPPPGKRTPQRRRHAMVERDAEMWLDHGFSNREEMDAHAAPLRDARQLPDRQPQVLDMLDHLIRAHGVERVIVEGNAEVIS